MFSRSTSHVPATAEPLRAASAVEAGPAVAAPPARPAGPGDGASRPALISALSTSGPLDRQPVSVIGRDLTIAGDSIKIISRGILQVDGAVIGDVQGTEIVIGEHGKVTGVVHGENVIVRGAVEGTIRGVRVTLASNATVEGEIQHRTLSIEQGAMFEGKARRHNDESELKPRLPTQ